MEVAIEISNLPINTANEISLEFEDSNHLTVFLPRSLIKQVAEALGQEVKNYEGLFIGINLTNVKVTLLSTE